MLKNIPFLLFVITLLLLASCQHRMLKIVCIGDSITQGKVTNDSITELSYRYWLWEKLDAAGYKVDMLGSNDIWFQENRLQRMKLPVSPLTGHIFDPHHEAFYGIKTGELLKGGFTHDSLTYLPLQQRLHAYRKPDIALVHIGTNDGKGDSLQTINYLKELIETLYARNPKITILLAKLNTPWVRFVNHSIEPVIAEFKAIHPKLKIVPVDMASGWVNCPQASGAMTFDWAHPNTLGQKTMADKWFKAFQSIGDRKSPRFNAALKITHTTATTATITWTPATDNKYIAGYNVYVNNQIVNWRSSECGEKSRQCIALVPGNSFTITGLQAGNKYVVRVTAVDFANNFTSSEELGLNLSNVK